MIDLFSKRQNRARGDVPDVYQYDDIPNPLRVQVVHILKDAFGDHTAYETNAKSAYEFINDTLCREYGVFELQSRANDHFEAVANFFLQTPEVEKAIDVIELAFRLIDRVVRDNEYKYSDIQLKADEAIAELNFRFREHGVGYQYESGIMVRVDSQLVHAEVVKPTLNILSKKMFKGANQEFLSAHDHYRNRKYKECLNDCLKAFESTMKAICDKRKWKYEKTVTSKKLISILFEKELIPPFMQSHFGGLRSTLEGGVPTIRNKLGGHGQGSEPTSVPESIASYALHLTATTILFLSKAENELK
jgi:hypothetical protein